MKKIPCGFYPARVNTLDKGDTVIGGTVVLPAEHKRWDKQVFVCLEHEEDSTSGVMEGVDSNTSKETLVGVDNLPSKQGEDTEGSSMDELESSILEDDKRTGLGLRKKDNIEEQAKLADEGLDSEFLSQSLFERS